MKRTSSGVCEQLRHRSAFTFSFSQSDQDFSCSLKTHWILQNALTEGKVIDAHDLSLLFHKCSKIPFHLTRLTYQATPQGSDHMHKLRMTNGLW